MRAVNLLPRETSSKKLGWNSEHNAAIALTVVIAVALLGGCFVERAHASSARQQLAAAQAALDLATSQRPAEQTQLHVPDVLSQAQPWHLALDSALSTRVSWDVLLSQLEYVVPAKVGLTTVRFGSAPGATGVTAATVSLGGSAFSLHDIATFLSTLAKVPTLSQVTLVSTAANVGSNAMTFQITAQVALPAAAVAPVAPTDTSTTGGTA